MTNNADIIAPANRPGFKEKIKPYITGLVPLFVLAHFGDHAVGAMLRPLMPMIRTGLGLDLTQAGWIMSAYTLTNGLSQLPAGWMADKLGARIMVLLGITGVAVAGFFIGFSNSFTWLVLLLMLSALLGGGYHPAASAAISKSTPEKYLGRSLGFHLIGGTSAFWAIPLIITPIAATWGWQMPYRIIPIPVAVLGVILFILIGKVTRADEARAAARKKAQIDEPVMAGRAKVPWGKLLAFIALSVLTGTMVMSASSFLVFFAADVLHISETAIPLLAAVTPAVGIVGAPFGGYLSDRFGGMKVITVVSFAAVPLIYLMGVAPNVGWLIVLMIAIGLVSNVRMPTSESFIAANTPANRRSSLLGIYFFAGTGVAGPLAPLIGNLIDHYGYQTTFTMTAIAAGVITLITAFFLWRFREEKVYPVEITG